MKHLKILITGGTSGIGLAIAKTFAAKGNCSLFLNGLEKNGDEIAAQLAQEYGLKCYFFYADLAEETQIEAMITDAYAKMGGVNVLVNNAGIQFVAAIENFPTEQWNRIIAVNLTAAFHTSKRVWAQMKEENFGRIINISSVHGLRASEFKSAYVAAKHGLNGLTKVLALEGAPFGITCNAICPGYVRTPLVEKQISDQAKAHQISEQEVIEKVMLKKQAVKKFVEPQLIGDMCLLLTSDAGGMISGANMTADGAWSVQ